MTRASEEALRRAERALDGRAQRDVPLGPLTTYRVGGPAALFVVADDLETLAATSRAARSSGLPVLVLGRGSNLLVADAGFPGIVVTLAGPFTDLRFDGTTLRAGGGVALPVAARRSATAGLAGFEWAVGVPGSIGGAVRMNAGGHGSDMAAVLRRVRVVDLATGEDGWMPASALELGYRTSVLQDHQVVIHADIELQPGDPAGSAALIEEIVRWRRANQPGGQNAGSVFANPPGDAAGRLIEVAGLRGHRLGTAHVSDKHANFVQADEGGRADDVAALVVEVRRLVEERCGVRLRTELRLIGFEDLADGS